MLIRFSSCRRRHIRKRKDPGDEMTSWLHARAGGSIDTLCMCPLRAETPLYLCSTALQYSPRLFPLLLLRLEKHFSDLPVIIQTNVSLMSVKKSSRFTESPPPHPPLTNFVALYCWRRSYRLFSGPKVIASESENGRKTFLWNHEFSDAESEIIL